MKLRYLPQDVKNALEEHYKKYGMKAFKDECYLVIDDDGGHLAVEFASEWTRRNGIGGKAVHIPDYENTLQSWIDEECRMLGVERLTNEERIGVEDDMTREHIMAMFEICTGN